MFTVGWDSLSQGTILATPHGNENLRGEGALEQDNLALNPGYNTY